MSERHEQWMARHGRSYGNDAEKQRRFLIFKDNMEFIESFNSAKNHPYKLSVNEYAKQTNEEFKASRNGSIPSHHRHRLGCCWAFSAVAAMKGIAQLKTGRLISLAEQELVDCDTSGEDQGCEGGLMDNAFEFIIQNKGLATKLMWTDASEACKLLVFDII